MKMLNKNHTAISTLLAFALLPLSGFATDIFLQHYFGWQSNFYFLGVATIALIVLEVLYSGETLKETHRFNINALLEAYSSKLKTHDYSVTLFILGLSYSLVMLYNLATPFIIEQIFHRSPVVTGNAALASGLAILVGGLISKATIKKNILDKVQVAGPLLLGLSGLFLITMVYFPSLQAMVVMVFLLHVVSGFTFNTFYAYAFGRFSTHAGIVSGLTGGGLYIITSLISYSVASALNVKSPTMLATAYVTIAVLITGSFFLFAQLKRTIDHKQTTFKPERILV